MKGGEAHRVPLAEAAVAVLAKARARWGSTGLVFRSARGTQIDEAALRRLLRHTGTEATVHGFRSTFKSWCMETRRSARACRAEPRAHVHGGRGSLLRANRSARASPSDHGAVVPFRHRHRGAEGGPDSRWGVSAPAAPVLLEHHVCERTGLSRSRLDALARAGVFPKPRRNRNGAHCS